MPNDQSGTEIVPLRPPGQLMTVPAIIADQGDRATLRFLEFFTATIRNANTRAAYAQAVGQFLRWCQDRQLSLRSITPMAVAAYIESHPGSIPTIKQHLAAIKTLFDWLVTGHIVEFNPAASVRGPKHIVKRGKTPVLDATDARTLLDSIPLKIGNPPKDGDPDNRPDDIIGLRDRALIAVMVFSFARVSAVIGMEVKDYYQNGKRWWLRLHEKGGNFHEVPAHHNAEAYLDAYLDASGIASDRKSPLFRSAAGKTGQLTTKQLHRRNALDMVKRRATAAGVAGEICNHTFRATGITAFRKNGGKLEEAQQIANHAEPRTTRLYDRSGDDITLDAIERIDI
jgi:integrase/recombinase XerD